MTVVTAPQFKFAPLRRVLLDPVSWETYQSLLGDLGDGHTRLTFDRGRLEIMSPLPIHENVKSVVARLLEAYADHAGIQAESFGMKMVNELLIVGLKLGQSKAVAELKARLTKC
jgi:Uma2 family endonuclease